MPKRPLFLVGMMGSGKTTAGRLLAEAVGCPFIDLDRRLERIAGASVSELLADGEDAFRDLEAASLRALLDEPGFARREVVVATGGGIVLRPENLRAMRRTGRVVYLECPVPVLAGRLAQDASRPLLAGADPAQRLQEILERRKPLYVGADAVVEASAPPDAVAQLLRQQWEAA